MTKYKYHKTFITIHALIFIALLLGMATTIDYIMHRPPTPLASIRPAKPIVPKFKIIDPKPQNDDKQIEAENIAQAYRQRIRHDFDTTNATLSHALKTAIKHIEDVEFRCSSRQSVVGSWPDDVPTIGQIDVSSPDTKVISDTMVPVTYIIITFNINEKFRIDEMYQFIDDIKQGKIPKRDYTVTDYGL